MKRMIIALAVSLGIGLYVVGCLAIGIYSGIFLYSHILHAPDQPFSWLKAVIAIYAGLFAVGILLIPTQRYGLPKCTECESGRLHTKTETLDTYEGRASMRLYYGMRGSQEFTNKRDTISCDRCNYETTVEYVSEGQITIH